MGNSEIKAAKINGVYAVLAAIIGALVMYWLNESSKPSTPVKNKNFDLAMKQYLQGNYKQALANFNTASFEEFPEANYFVGLMHEKGLGITKNLDKAKYYYNLGIEKKDTKAYIGLESLDREFGYQDMGDCEDFYFRAFNAIEAVSEKNTYWKVQLARMYLYGLGTNKDISKGKQLFYEVWEKDKYGEAAYYLAQYFYDLRGYDSALVWGYKAAKSNYSGNGVVETVIGASCIKTNRAKDGLHWLKEAWAKGNINATYFLGLIYWKGMSIRPDIPKAKYYFENLHQLHITEGTIALARLNLHSLKDTGSFINIISEAANENCPEALFELGRFYYDNYRKEDALTLLGRAADNNYCEAEQFLGDKSVSEEKKAYWHNRAIIHGYKPE